MQLKEIEIKGFKSFANKIKLNITPGITVIVGPNGCGKSNITDAVRWILGEQNIRSLRGVSLTDMIFSGNKYQKMANMASVSIIFDNSDRKLTIDSEEVELKRIVYRSGETENYINGMPCKLKDIHELFWGTGLGKNSYSIIAQGKVDFVLNAKPTERRVLFEEAANVSNYNNKKEIALKKLESVQNNLIRINDILSEVRENLLYYKKKADDLKNYHILKDEIRKLEYYILSQQYLFIEKNIKKYEDQLLLLKRDLGEMNFDLTDTRKSIQKLEKTKEEIHQNLREMDERYFGIERERDRIDSQTSLLEQKINEKKQTVLNLTDEGSRSKVQYQKFIDTLADIDREIKQTDQSKSSINKKISHYENQLEQSSEISKEYDQRMNRVKEINELLNNENIRELKEEKIKQETMIKSLNISLKEVIQEELKLKESLINNEQSLEKIEKTTQLIEHESKKLLSERARTQKEIQELESEVLKDINLLQEYDNEMVLKKKEIAFLEELFKKNLGDSRGENFADILCKKYPQVKWIGNPDHIIEDIPDFLKKIMTYILRKYHKNLFIIFEPIDSDKLAGLNEYATKQEISNLKIITNHLNTNESLLQIKEDLKNRKNVIGFLDELIKCSPDNRFFLKRLFGNILIVKDSLIAFEMIDNVDERISVLSLDGIMIDSQKIIQINTLNEKDGSYDLEHPGERVDGIKTEIVIIRNLEKEINHHLENCRKNLSKLNRKINQLDQQIEEYSLKLHDSKNYYINNNKMNIEIKKDIHRITEKMNKNKLYLDKLEENKKLSEKTIQLIDLFSERLNRFGITLLKVKGFCEKNIDAIQKNIEKEKINYNWNKERESLLIKQKNEMNHFIQTYHNEEEKRNIKIDLNKKEVHSIIEKKDHLFQDYLNKKEEINVINKRRELKRQELRQFNEKVVQLNKTIEMKQSRVEMINRKIHETQMDRLQNQEKQTYLLQTVQNQYNTTIKEILNYQNISKNQKEATQKISNFKEKITQMGQINFDALQEFQKLNIRYNDLEENKEEIKKSKEKLIELVIEIDRVAEENFLNTYAKVERYFKDIFEKLFHGGQVSLQMTKNKKVLESGIEVMAQPPGKKLQSIALLSTGERALTAIALLFALWKANPSPFCFFDEIDSALDENNAIRLASFLKNEDLKGAQIIIITHQKGVMEAADALYGITMEGSGVSSLMSVKMIDMEVGEN